ncbi:hypothetical protein HPB51_002706 [Rhipicephalus microplus]|uniref:Uncharacterized protein n=1 Tax=Rhipicephalus microplus TaxID=6941 RepID=A0A9J6E5R0_RHIMP|nr:hypothetical protein HPB51_002706 [Rhipicephalus microplus]
MVGWPLVLVTQFRTAKESVTLVNSALHHSEVSVWTERLPAALELAAAYKTTTVFVNGQGLRDASVEFGSRSGVACGERGLLTFVKSPGSSAELSSRASTEFNLEKYGVEEKDVSCKIGESHGLPSITGVSVVAARFPVGTGSVFTVSQRVIFRSVERVGNTSDSPFRRMKHVVQPELSRMSFVAIPSLRETVHACVRIMSNDTA